MELLKKNNLPVGCISSLVQKYLVDVYQFKEQNIKIIEDSKLFEQGNIFAVFLELPYDKVFLNKNCKDYSSTRLLTQGFGGLGFVSINRFNPWFSFYDFCSS